MAGVDDAPLSAVGRVGDLYGFFDERNVISPVLALRSGSGSWLGEPVDRNDHLFGSTGAPASWICQAADPGQTPRVGCGP